MHWFDRVLFAAIAVVTFFVAGLYFDAQDIFYFPREPFDFRDGPQQILSILPMSASSLRLFKSGR